MKSPSKDYALLDAVVVLFVLSIVAFIAWALVFRTVPDNQLAILASIASGLTGTVVGAYAGFRWATSKQASETIADLASRTPPSGQPQEVVVVNTPSDPAQVQQTDGPEGTVRRDP